ncbi:hypothetical protein [uncultured Desulfobacter sp.]|uniref:hypothetical protein n=1 Tax=uncultured Desulfobacter sp. TaxID=240139 RepID=UPI0029F525C0|nr:hypothetical protein [uncultured Desulfobacter sp.]
MFHVIYLLIIIILVIALIIALKLKKPPEPTNAQPQPQESGSVRTHLLNNVVLSAGINFDTGQPIVVNTLTGKKVDPCGTVSVPKEEQSNQLSERPTPCQTETACQTELRRNPDGGYELYKKMEGEYVKVEDSKIVEMVFATWKGSQGMTIHLPSGGEQFEDVQTLDGICDELRFLLSGKMSDPARKEAEAMLSMCP